MPLEITTQEESETMAKYTVKERLYYTQDRDRVVSEGDPEAAFLFAPKGRQILEAEALRFGLIDDGAAPDEPSPEPATAEATEPPAAPSGPGDDTTVVSSVTAEPADESPSSPAPEPAGEEGHVCPDCGKVCKTEFGLDTHRRAKHG